MSVGLAEMCAVLNNSILHKKDRHLFLKQFQLLEKDDGLFVK